MIQFLFDLIDWIEFLIRLFVPSRENLLLVAEALAEVSIAVNIVVAVGLAAAIVFALFLALIFA